MIFSFLLFAAGTAAPTAAPLAPLSAPNGGGPNITVLRPTWGSAHEPVLYLIQILFMVSVVGLVALMSIQTTKTEGLSGSIGGRAESAYKGRLGIEQQLSRLTNGFAIAFMFLAILDFLITR